MIDKQLFVACLAVACFAGAVIGYIAREIEGFDPQPFDGHEPSESDGWLR